MQEIKCIKLMEAKGNLGVLFKHKHEFTTYSTLSTQLYAQFFEFIEYHSTWFGRSFRPSSGVQDCTYSIRYMSYRFVDCMLEGTRWNCSSTLCPLASNHRTCMTYTWCYMHSLELLMIDGKTVRNM